MDAFQYAFNCTQLDHAIMEKFVIENHAPGASSFAQSQTEPSNTLRDNILCFQGIMFGNRPALDLTMRTTQSVLRNIMPQIGNNYIINVKDTSVMFIISFTEFFAFHRYITGLNLMYFPSATIEMIGYLIMTLTASVILRFIEKLMDGSNSYELVEVDSLTMTAGTYNHPSRGTPFDEKNRKYKSHLEQAAKAAQADEARHRLRESLKNRNGSPRGGR